MTSLSSPHSQFSTIFTVLKILKDSQLTVAGLKWDKIVMDSSVKVAAQWKQKGEQDNKMCKEWE